MKSYLGLDKLYYALVTDSVDAYSAEAPAVLAPVATIGIEPATNVKTQYFDNKPAETLTAEGETKLPLEVQGIPLELKALLLGKKYDATKGQMFGGGGTPPYVAIGFRAKKTDGTFHYWWFLKGRFSSPKEEASTQTDTPDPKTTKLDFTAVKTQFEFAQTEDLNDSSDRVEADDDDAAVDPDDWFASVQLPVGGTPDALTVTPSPADGASGVAVGATITLTFSNPLRAGAENGIFLAREDTQAPIDCTRTISADRTVVTLDPDSDLASAKTFWINIPGVVDIYGQALENTIVNFDTA